MAKVLAKASSVKFGGENPFFLSTAHSPRQSLSGVACDIDVEGNHDAYSHPGLSPKPSSSTQLLELRRLLTQDARFLRQSCPQGYQDEESLSPRATEPGCAPNGGSQQSLLARLVSRKRISTDGGDSSVAGVASRSSVGGAEAAGAHSPAPSGSGWATPTLFSEPGSAYPSRNLIRAISQAEAHSPHSSCPGSPHHPRQPPGAHTAPYPLPHQHAPGASTPGRHRASAPAVPAVPGQRPPLLTMPPPPPPMVLPPLPPKAPTPPSAGPPRKLSGALPHAPPPPAGALPGTRPPPPRPPPLDGAYLHGGAQRQQLHPPPLSLPGQRPPEVSPQWPGDGLSHYPSAPLPSPTPSAASSTATTCPYQAAANAAALQRARPSRFMSRSGAFTPPALSPPGTPSHGNSLSGEGVGPISATGELFCAPSSPVYAPSTTSTAPGWPGGGTPFTADAAQAQHPYSHQHQHPHQHPHQHQHQHQHPQQHQQQHPTSPYAQLRRSSSQRSRDAGPYPPPPLSAPLSPRLSQQQVMQAPSSPTSSTASGHHYLPYIPQPHTHPASASAAPPAPAAHTAPGLRPRTPGAFLASTLFLCRCVVAAYYAALVYADLEAWHERVTAARTRAARYGYAASTWNSYDGGDGGSPWAGYPLGRLLAAADVDPHFPLAHTVLAVPCLLVMALGAPATPLAAATLALRLLVHLAAVDGKALLFFWRGQAVQLLRVKELAVVGATLVFAARAAPTGSRRGDTLAGGAAGKKATSPSGGGAGGQAGPAAARQLSRQPSSQPSRQPSRQPSSSALLPGSDRRPAGSPSRTTSTTSLAALVGVGGGAGSRASPSSSSLTSSAAPSTWGERWRQGGGLRELTVRVGALLIAPLFAYYACVQVEHLHDMTGETLSEAVVELLSESYRWLPRGDGSLNTHWLPLQVALALPLYLGLTGPWMAPVLATAVLAEASLCWRFWLRGSVLWSYGFYVWRHFLANAVVAAGLLLQLPATQLHARPGGLRALLRKKSK